MVNSPYAEVNGELHLLDSENTEIKSIIIDGRTLIPLRFLQKTWLK